MPNDGADYFLNIVFKQNVNAILYKKNNAFNKNIFISN
jgi:hypothetical protein